MTLDEAFANSSAQGAAGGDLFADDGAVSITGGSFQRTAIAQPGGQVFGDAIADQGAPSPLSA